MNPFEVQHTFNAYFNWGDDPEFPTGLGAQSVGRGWGSGNGKKFLTIKFQYLL